MDKNKKSADIKNYWKEQVNKWKASGLIQAEYCKHNNLDAKYFSLWKNKLSQPEKITTKQRAIEELRVLSSQLEKWRNTPNRRKAIPEEYWQKAASLSKFLKTGKIAETLHFNFQKLNKKINEYKSVPKKKRTTKNKADFLEIDLKKESESNNCNIELENKLGEKISIQANNKTAKEYVDFIKTFLAK